MEISFQDKIFDTASDIEIRYDEQETIDEFAGYIMRETGGKKGTAAGFITDRYPFLSNLSIIENIILPLEYHRGVTTREAAELDRKYWSRLGLDAVLMKRKENVRTLDLFKAMFVRAVSLDPEMVFFISPEEFVPVREFERLLPVYQEITGGKIKFWVGVHEGIRLQWRHDAEVKLHV